MSWKTERQQESKDYLDEEYVDLDQVLADQPVKLDPKLRPDQRENSDRKRIRSKAWIEGSGDVDDVDDDDDEDEEEVAVASDFFSSSPIPRTNKLVQ